MRNRNLRTTGHFLRPTATSKPTKRLGRCKACSRPVAVLASGRISACPREGRSPSPPTATDGWTGVAPSKPAKPEGRGGRPVGADRVPGWPDWSWPDAQAREPRRRRAPRRQGSWPTENFARCPKGPARERIPSVPCDRTRSPPLAPAGRTSRPGTKSHRKF